MIDEPDLLRFIEGECTTDEAAAIQAWIAADPRRADLLKELRALWRLTGDRTRDWDVAQARERLRRAPGPAPRTLELLPQSPPASRRVWRPAAWPMRIAAALGLLIAAAAFWYLDTRPAPFHEYATAPGQRSVLTLRDGSRVTLSVDTRLRVPRDYGDRERLVELEGEAYFDVRHDPDRPFVVRTLRGTMEDLGTEFDVRAYRQEDYLQVVVASGAVAVRAPGRADSTVLTLHPRERGVLDAHGATRSTGVRLDAYLGWIRGTLRFDDAPLGAVLTQLERWYDLDIVITDPSLEEERVTISFTTPSPDEALEALARVLDLRVTRAGRLARLGPADGPP